MITVGVSASAAPLLADNYIHGNVIKMRDGTFNGITTMNATDPASYSISRNK